MKSIHIATFILLLLVSYSVGFISGAKKYFPFTIVHKIYYSLKTSSLETLDFNTCEIEEIFELPSIFSVIIGHAYGSPSKSKNNDFIAPNIEIFLLDNKSKIKNIIFTGDIFSVPTRLKWDSLFKKFGSDKIHVAPGEHDILSLEAKDIFKKNKFIKKTFPYNLPFNDNLSIVIDDSISSNFRVSNDLKSFISNITTERMFIARHNMPISELLPYANSINRNFYIVPSVKNFINDFSKNKDFTWIMGNGGAHERLPRITCHSFQNHRFIINGIGEIKGDTILIIYNGKIYKHVLK